jgi:excisionase family DNA binding protein
MGRGDAMTIAEAAKRLGRSEQSIRRAIKSGKLMAVMVNGRYEIDEKELPDSQADSQSDSTVLVTENEFLRQRTAQLEDTLKQQNQRLDEAQRLLAEASERHDTIVLQLTRQLEQSQRLLEYHQAPWWRRWFRRGK